MLTFFWEGMLIIWHVALWKIWKTKNMMIFTWGGGKAIFLGGGFCLLS